MTKNVSESTDLRKNTPNSPIVNASQELAAVKKNVTESAVNFLNGIRASFRPSTQLAHVDVAKANNEAQVSPTVETTPNVRGRGKGRGRGRGRGRGQTQA